MSIKITTIGDADEYDFAKIDDGWGFKKVDPNIRAQVAEIATRDATRNAKKKLTSKSVHSIIATCNGECVGRMKFVVEPHYKREGTTLILIGHNVFTCGTWVHPEYRRCQIGIKMWSKMIRKFKPFTIFSDVASDDGMRLIESIRKKFTKGKIRRIKFFITDERRRNECCGI